MKRIGPDGARLPRDAIRAQRWAFGWLAVGREPQARHARRMDCAAMLLPMDGSTVALAELHAVRVSIERRGILLDGVEESFRRKQRFEHAQTWWCKPITEEEYERATAPDPVDVEEGGEQLNAAVITGESMRYTPEQQRFLDEVSAGVGRGLSPDEEAYCVSAFESGADIGVVVRYLRMQDVIRRELGRPVAADQPAQQPRKMRP